MLQIKSFKTEYQENPICVSNFTPRFSWKYDGGSFIIQSSYRILVASCEEFLNVGKADVWDSGIVKSDNMVGIIFKGKTLEPRQIYFVKCICECDGKQVESNINTFEMTLSENDWKGKWVSIPVNFNGGTLYFRKNLIELDGKKVKKARAYICGIGYHELYFNGIKIGTSILNPSVTDYSKRVAYMTYDFIDALKEKDNVVGIEVGYGWYGSRKLLAEFYVEFEDGSIYEDHSTCCNGWWVSGSPVIGNSIYGGEIYDARKEDNYGAGWSTYEFQPTWANGFMYTILTDAPTGKLEAELIEPIEIIKEYKEVSRTIIKDNIFVVNIGQNISGFAKIKVSGERGAEISLKYAEGVNEDGSINQLNLRSAICQDIYILNGREEEIYNPRFTYHGFQYIEVKITGKAKVLDIIGLHIHTDVKQIGEFECSNKILNQLHKNAVITEANNLFGIMTDCPQRDERFGWLNDISSRIFQTVYNFRMDRFLPKFLKDITHSQTEDGAIADTVPFYTGGQPADVVCISYLLLGLEAYKQYGDEKTIKEEYNNLKKWVDLLLTHQKDYIMDYYYYADWVPPTVFEDSKTDGIYVSCIFLYWHLITLAYLAKITGNIQDYEKYNKLGEASKIAINNKYFNAETANYQSGTQAENSLALNLGIVPEKFRAKVAENIVLDIRKRNYHSTCGNQGYRHMFYILTEYGYIEDLIKMITNPEYPGWGYMIENGATTIWERWEKKMENEMHSFDHPMFGSFDAWLYKYLGGISIDDDAKACDKITINPYIPESITFVNSSLDTIRGKIVSNWIRTNNSIKYHIEVPSNTKAKVVISGNEKILNAGIYDL